MTEISLSLTGEQHRQSRAHLLPGDGKEAVAIALCGRRAGDRRHRLLVRSLHLVPYEACIERTEVTVAWPTDLMVPWLEEADRRGLSVVKFHSHPGDYQRFSPQDDASDFALFPCIAGWIGAEVPHPSVVMLPDGRMFGRAFAGDPEPRPLASIMVVGDDLMLWHHDEFDGQSQAPLPAFTQRHAQAFGESTTRRLRRMSAAVIGASGTGSIVIEKLMRLGIGRLVIVDDDIVKNLNLNRILNATAADAKAKRLKVVVAERTIKATGLGTDVRVVAANLKSSKAIREVAQCDLLFGCVDSAEGRFVANQIGAFYLLPYIDVGVALDADDTGAITQVCGYVHYLQPGLSSLISRGAISMDDVNAEALRRQNRAFYEGRRKAGYINNVVEDRPAVSVDIENGRRLYRRTERGRFVINRLVFDPDYIEHIFHRTLFPNQLVRDISDKSRSSGSSDWTIAAIRNYFILLTYMSFIEKVDEPISKPVPRNLALVNRIRKAVLNAVESIIRGPNGIDIFTQAQEQIAASVQLWTAEGLIQWS